MIGRHFPLRPSNTLSPLLLAYTSAVLAHEFLQFVEIGPEFAAYEVGKKEGKEIRQLPLRAFVRASGGVRQGKA